jgi:hypothetical protein
MIAKKALTDAQFWHEHSGFQIGDERSAVLGRLENAPLGLA